MKPSAKINSGSRSPHLRWLCCAVLVLLLAVPPPAFTQILSLDGREIILNTTETPLGEILDRFSDFLNADIYLVGGDDHTRITRYQRHTDPIQLLASVLKSHSYAVVYRDQRGEVRTLADAIGPTGPASDLADSSRPIDQRRDPDPRFLEETARRQHQHMRTHFEKEIANLRNMIDNGEAEAFFPEPEARLASLEDRLSEISEE